MQNDNLDLIIVGLGNPGPRYRQTLHNVGFKIVEKLAEAYSWSWKFENKFQAEIAKGKVDATTYHLLRPQTFMNLSGEAVKAYVSFYQLRPSHVLVVADDADLPLGQIRLRPSGGSGGHNGLKSLEKELLTNDFKRLRFGIGRPELKEISLADYVLMPQGEQVWDLLDSALKSAVSLLVNLANAPFENVMKAANTKAVNGEK